MARVSTNPRIRDYALRLLASRTSNGDPAASGLTGVVAALRLPLSTLVGVAGFTMLLRRALTLTITEYPLLSAVQVQPDGSVEGLEEIDAAVIPQAGLAFISHLLALLVAFIGEDLMLKIVFDVGPDPVVPSPKTPSGESKDDPRRQSED